VLRVDKLVDLVMTNTIEKHTKGEAMTIQHRADDLPKPIPVNSPCTVGELIEILSKLDKDMSVYLGGIELEVRTSYRSHTWTRSQYLCFDNTEVMKQYLHDIADRLGTEEE